MFMNTKISRKNFEKMGFVPVQKAKEYTVLKSAKGLVLAYNDGAVEGFLTGDLKENIILEGFSRSLVELLLIIGLGTTYFTTDITVVSGTSMEPTYRSGKVIIRSKASSTVEKILVNKRSIVKLKSPDGETMIKRVVGVPGDEIEYRGGMVFINGEHVGYNRSWLLKKQNIAVKSQKDMGKFINEPFFFKLKSDEYYVMGDNTVESVDSRSYGPITLDCIISIVEK